MQPIAIAYFVNACRYHVLRLRKMRNQRHHTMLHLAKPGNTYTENVKKRLAQRMQNLPLFLLRLHRPMNEKMNGELMDSWAGLHCPASYRGFSAARSNREGNEMSLDSFDNDIGLPRSTHLDHSPI